jgi:hypothetical protein
MGQSFYGRVRAKIRWTGPDESFSLLDWTGLSFILARAKGKLYGPEKTSPR